MNQTISPPSALWVLSNMDRTDARLRLFCFPYAGAGASVFQHWSKALPPYVQVCPVQLPGRQNRLMEPPFSRLAPLTETLSQALLPYLTSPYAFFGHSMGALISFELARQLRRQAYPEPAHLFVSGCRAPHLVKKEPPVHLYPDNVLIEELRRMKIVPESLLQNKDLLQLLLPVLRADCAVCDTYVYAPEQPLRCPITAFGGQDDACVSRHELGAWRYQTYGEYRQTLFSGNHFFIHSSQESLLRSIADCLSEIT
jgi:medium-chain acyl-[acyl-carrier-protein] hydrolase